jgi:hypothetical protein
MSIGWSKLAIVAAAILVLGGTAYHGSYIYQGRGFFGVLAFVCLIFLLVGLIADRR